MKADALLRLDDYIVNSDDKLSPDILVLAGINGVVASLPICGRSVVILWPPNTSETRIKRDISNLAMGGYSGPYTACRLADAINMIKYYADEPGYLVLLDAPIRHIDSGTKIGLRAV